MIFDVFNNKELETAVYGQSENYNKKPKHIKDILLNIPWVLCTVYIILFAIYRLNRIAPCYGRRVLEPKMVFLLAPFFSCFLVL